MRKHFIEALAELEHKRWSSWMKYLFEKSTLNTDGTATIPAWAVQRWSRQMNTPYDLLSNEEKESDRVEALNTLDVVSSYLSPLGINLDSD